MQILLIKSVSIGEMEYLKRFHSVIFLEEVYTRHDTEVQHCLYSKMNGIVVVPSSSLFFELMSFESQEEMSQSFLVYSEKGELRGLLPDELCIMWHHKKTLVYGLEAAGLW